MARRRRFGRRRRGGRRHGLPKSVGGWISLAFHAIGAALAISPAIEGVQFIISTGDVRGGLNNIGINYTGYDIVNGQFLPQKLGSGAGAVIGGIVLAKIGSFLGRMF